MMQTMREEFQVLHPTIAVGSEDISVEAVTNQLTTALLRTAPFGGIGGGGRRGDRRPQRRADATFDVTGARAGLTLAGEVNRLSCTVAIVGCLPGGERTPPLATRDRRAFQIVNPRIRDEVMILGGMRLGLRLRTDGRLDLFALVAHRFPLKDRGREGATAILKRPGCCKATVIVSPECRVPRS